MSIEFESIHNYYESAVFDEVARLAKERRGKIDKALLADIACVALNHLPPRYIRHEVDLVFYLTPQEREANARMVNEAVKTAFEFVLNRGKRRAA